jgi:hypothetical protein
MVIPEHVSRRPLVPLALSGVLTFECQALHCCGLGKVPLLLASRTDITFAARCIFEGRAGMGGAEGWALLGRGLLPVKEKRTTNMKQTVISISTQVGD